MDINWIAVVAAAASSFLLGGLWYSALFAKPWMQVAGLTEAKPEAAIQRLSLAARLCWR